MCHASSMPWMPPASISLNLHLENSRCKFRDSILLVGRATVFKWKNKMILTDKKKTRRPKILSSSDKIQIKAKMYQKFGSSVRKTPKILSLSKRNSDQGKKISKSTV